MANERMGWHLEDNGEWSLYDYENGDTLTVGRFGDAGLMRLAINVESVVLTADEWATMPLRPVYPKAMPDPQAGQLVDSVSRRVGLALELLAKGDVGAVEGTLQEALAMAVADPQTGEVERLRAELAQEVSWREEAQAESGMRLEQIAAVQAQRDAAETQRNALASELVAFRKGLVEHKPSGELYDLRTRIGAALGLDAQDTAALPPSELAERVASIVECKAIAERNNASLTAERARLADELGGARAVGPTEPPPFDREVFRRSAFLAALTGAVAVVDFHKGHETEAVAADQVNHAWAVADAALGVYAGHTQPPGPGEPTKEDFERAAAEMGLLVRRDAGLFDGKLVAEKLRGAVGLLRAGAKKMRDDDGDAPGWLGEVEGRLDALVSWLRGEGGGSAGASERSAAPPSKGPVARAVAHALGRFWWVRSYLDSATIELSYPEGPSLGEANHALDCADLDLQSARAALRAVSTPGATIDDERAARQVADDDAERARYYRLDHDAAIARGEPVEVAHRDGLRALSRRVALVIAMQLAERAVADVRGRLVP